MKQKAFLKRLCALVMVLMLLLGCAVAEEYDIELSSDVQSTQLQLFTSGAIPQPRRMRAVTPAGFADYVAEQMRQQPEKINVLSYGIRPENLPALLSDIINNNPDLFYIGSNIQYTTGSKTGNVYNIFPEYLYSGEDLKKRIADFNATVDQITAYAKGISSDPIGRMLAVNDYFCINYQYDNSLSIYGPDQLFTGGSGVCQAYMLAYAAVLDQLGIENTHATSYAMNHTWNLVKLGSDWYHVDVTWNDPDNGLLRTSYRYFLLSDAGMESNKHYGWTASYSANNAAYDNFFWRSATTPLGVNGSKVFFFDDAVSAEGMRTIRCWNIGESTTSQIHRFSIVGPDGSYSYTLGIHPIAVDASKVYYAARGNLYSISHSGDNERLLYSINDGRIIWSCWKQGKEVQMQVSEASGKNTKLIRYDFQNLPNLKDQKLTLPASTAIIGEEAFFGTAAAQVQLPATLKSIGDRAFAGSSALRYVEIPNSVTSISASAFENSPNVTLIVPANSYAHSYAVQMGMNCLIAY